ncbi:MAG: gamma-glutamyl-gamma-aminobutyrate hydrolase family protein [Clostridia bacterium]|nr:gamma-glutamyl-gamma-aminobutyrate hydrolase family protein [Clostridia bacterium]
MSPKIFLSTPTKTINYTTAFSHCGAECLGGYLTPYPDNITEICDGLVLCGGVDVHPKYYNEEINGAGEIDDARDVHEMELLAKFVRAGKPVLGICRGHQVINIYFDGSLVQDLPTRDLHTADEDLPHAVSAEGESIVSSLYGNRFVTNSAHHQAVKTAGKGLRITHYSETDHVAEAIQHESLPIIGVQWHPERMSLAHRRPDTVDGLPLIQYFVDLCGK